MTKPQAPTREITYSIDATLAEWAEDGVFYCVQIRDEPSEGYLRLATRTDMVRIPKREDLIAAKIGGLTAERQRIRAEAEKHATKIEREIQKLLAISYDERPADPNPFDTI
jgi:hypothetical protein